MTRVRLELLQWFGLLGGALAFTLQHVVGFGISDASCNAAGAQWGLHTTAMQVTLSVLAGLVVLAAEGAALLAFRATANVDKDAPGPNGRVHFFAQAALLGNVLFFVIVVLDAVGTLYHLPCNAA